MIFLSTLPVRGATPQLTAPSGGWNISIHAPREGSDWKTTCGGCAGGYFYPRSP